MERFQVYLSKDGQYRFRLMAPNNKIIAVSEGYETKQGALNGVESVKKNAPTAFVEELK